MSTGSCRNCKYSQYVFNANNDDLEWKCARLPIWVKIKDIDAHWCGEWKDVYKE